MAKFIDKILGRSAADKKQLTDDINVVSLLDRFSTYPSKGLTPGRLAALLTAADQGDVLRQMELYEEMLEKDAKLASLCQARRLSVSRKQYEILAGSDSERDVMIAKEARTMFARVPDWNGAVRDLLDAIPKGFSVMQIQWKPNGKRIDIAGLKHIHQKKFRFGSMIDLNGDPEQLRLLIDTPNIDSFRGIVSEQDLSRAASDGIALDTDPMFRMRFMVMIAKSRTGNPARAAVLRSCVYPFMFKNYDIKWWIRFAEVLLGYRIGHYDPNEEGQKELLTRAVRGLATDTSAVISNNSKIEFVEMLGKASSHQVYKEIKETMNEEMAQAVLGHTGSSQSTPGKLGNETAATDVKQEFVESDALLLDETVTDQGLRTWVDINFGPQENYPIYKTHIEPDEDLLAVADLVQRSQAVGHEVSSKWFTEKVGIPSPDPKDKEDHALVPRPAAGGFLTAGKDAVDEGGKKKVHRLMSSATRFWRRSTGLSKKL